MPFFIRWASLLGHRGVDADLLALAVCALELHAAVDKSEERVVAADADVVAWMKIACPAGGR
jgi:hypothetical protein